MISPWFVDNLRKCHVGYLSYVVIFTKLVVGWLKFMRIYVEIWPDTCENVCLDSWMLSVKKILQFLGVVLAA